MIAAWKPASAGRRGGQRKFSDHAIETALMLRLVFKLPLRQPEGFLRPILSLTDIDLEAPDPTTLLRRSQGLNVQLDRVAGDNSISSSTARGYLWLAKANGLPPSMVVAAGVAGRSFISVLIERE